MVNHKRVHRLWRLAGSTQPRRSRKKRSKPEAGVPRAATRPNDVWTYDFIHDACFGGRKLKMLTVVDEFTRECLAIEVATSLPSGRVITVLERLFEERGGPEYIRSDNGPEFIAERVQRWLEERGSETIYITPGHPWENAHEESFNGRFRDECLNMEVFSNVVEARVVIEEWRRHYNEERLHGSLGYRTPREFREVWLADHQVEAGAAVLGLSHCGQPDGRGKNREPEAEGRARSPAPVGPISTATRLGARVAPLRSPILRPGKKYHTARTETKATEHAQQRA
jgi:putative transposase